MDLSGAHLHGVDDGMTPSDGYFVEPPSASISEPCSRRPWGERMNATRAAMSSGSPTMRDLFLAARKCPGPRRVHAMLRRGLSQALVETRSLHRTGIDAVHLNAVAQTEVRQGFGEGEQSRVDGAADGELGAGRPAAGARDIHDRARRSRRWGHAARVSRTAPNIFSA